MTTESVARTILVVDDKRNMLRLMTKVIGTDAKVLTADCGEDAVRIVRNNTVHVVLCDLKMPDMNGLEVLRSVKSIQPKIEFILMTAFASVGTAVEALKLGAYDYIAKPFEPGEARNILLSALARATASSPNKTRDEEQVLPHVIARSQIMCDLGALVRRISDSNITTLILGETGTGKEPIARAVHDLSPRAGERFVALNCAAIPPELLESELFGHARGSFTGAIKDKKGLFEEAHGGSLFLDEIGDLRPSLQAKLTRVLEEHAIRRVGESRERPIDVRLIAATHRNLEEMVSSGSFREDLWYRLNVALVNVPPLRQRREDIELLATYFLRKQREHNPHRTIGDFSAAAREALVDFDWPGNVRQLRSAIERASIVSSSGEILLSDLPPELSNRALSSDEAESFMELTWAQALERGRSLAGTRYLEAVLNKFDGQVVDAAAHAGVERESFYRLLRKYGVEQNAPRSRPSVKDYPD